MTETKNIDMAVAVGCLNTLAEKEPAEHTRKARLCMQLAKCVLEHGVATIPTLDDSIIEIGVKAIEASVSVCEKLAEEYGIPMDHVILNLASFCMDSINCPKTLFKQLEKVFECWYGADRYEDIRLGHRVYERLQTEIEILAIGELNG